MHNQLNPVLAAIENDRKYSLQKRKLMHARNPSTEMNLKKAPTADSLRHKSTNQIDYSSLMDLQFRTPKQQIVYPPQRMRTDGNPQYHQQHPTLPPTGMSVRKKSRCSSASSHTSAKLRIRYSEMQKIREDNERMVEKILLAKPTLQSRIQHRQSFIKHKEISKRLSRYSQASPSKHEFRRNPSPNRRDTSLKEIILPDLPRKRSSFRQYFPAKYNYEPHKGKNSFLRQ